jgi:hypothetical protein
MHPSSKTHDALSNQRMQRLLPHRTTPLKLEDSNTNPPPQPSFFTNTLITQTHAKRECSSNASHRRTPIAIRDPNLSLEKGI